MSLTLQESNAEPWVAVRLETPVLEPLELSLIGIPMNVGLTLDLKRMVLVDSVDHYQLMKLDKAAALELASQFQALAEAMLDDGASPNCP